MGVTREAAKFVSVAVNMIHPLVCHREVIYSLNLTTHKHDFVCCIQFNKYFPWQDNEDVVMILVNTTCFTLIELGMSVHISEGIYHQ